MKAKTVLFMRLQENEDRAKADCGCVLAVDEFRMCPLHNAADHLIAVLEYIDATISNNLDIYQLEDEIEEVINIARGRGKAK